MNLFSEQSKWCREPNLDPHSPGFFLFRKEFTVDTEKVELRINVTADNRYNLYLDGKLLGRGPCRGDLQHYNYETYCFPIDTGKHVLSAEVVVFGATGERGKETALSEVHLEQGLLVAGGVFDARGAQLLSLDTPHGWQCTKDESRSHRALNADDDLKTFVVIPPMEHVDFSKQTKEWREIDYDSSSWENALSSGDAILAENRDNATLRTRYLYPRQIPMMEERTKHFASVVKSEGVSATAVFEWLSGRNDLRIEAYSKIVIDAGTLNTAFPRLAFAGGEGSLLSVKYSESLFVDGKKLVRDDASGEVVGYSDLLELDGKECVFEPFWFRTFRFIEISISDNARTPLKLERPSFRTFMYPFKLEAGFECRHQDIKDIWNIAWRTVRLCAHEHYYDCPYYEQMQYVGDTRIQALLSYALTGDDRLGKQAIRQYDWSRLPEGLSQSRYPNCGPEIISGFCLYWVMMVKDHFDYFADRDLVREVFPGVMSVLNRFEEYRNERGMISSLPHWNFVDWVPEWPMGNADRNLKEPITVLSLQYAEACRITAALAWEIGENCSVDLTNRYVRTIAAVNQNAYDSSRGLYLDMPGYEYVSQHTNAWAIIADAAPETTQKRLGRKIFEDKPLSKATLYFSFYMFRIWEKLDQYEYFGESLEMWRSLLQWNFTTFPETPVPETRSDCHAWSSSPMFELITGVLGIQPGSAGFESVLIKPNCSFLKRASGHAPIGKRDEATVRWELADDDTFFLDLGLSSPRMTTIVWPDGKQEDLGQTTGGKFRRKLKKTKPVETPLPEPVSA